MDKRLGRTPVFLLTVLAITWANADTYCRWAKQRLPNTYEWQKAARGIGDREYPWGDEFPDRTRGNEMKPKYGLFDFDWNESVLKKLTSVGRYEAGKSPYDIYDMWGYPSEWVDTEHTSYFTNAYGGRSLSWPGSEVADEGHPHVSFRCAFSPVNGQPERDDEDASFSKPKAGQSVDSEGRDDSYGQSQRSFFQHAAPPAIGLGLSIRESVKTQPRLRMLPPSLTPRDGLITPEMKCRLSWTKTYPFLPFLTLWKTMIISSV